MNPLQYLKSFLGGNRTYQLRLIRSYSIVPVLMATRALPQSMGAVYRGLKGDREGMSSTMLEGAAIWGRSVAKMTNSEIVTLNDIQPERRGRLVFVNHVCELDFPFDSIVLRLPYLANQYIKSTLFAYWWMKGMGSEVFDETNRRTISESVRNLMTRLEDSSFIVYPEGTLSYSEDIKTIKKGMVRLAYENQIPVDIVLKSGVSTLLNNQKRHRMYYKHMGTFTGEGLADWKEYRQFMQETFEGGKAALDREAAEHAQSA